VSILTDTPVTYNDPGVDDRMLPSLNRAAGPEHLVNMHAVTLARILLSFSESPRAFLFLFGAMPLDADPKKAAYHHTPDFFIDERHSSQG